MDSFFKLMVSIVLCHCLMACGTAASSVDHEMNSRFIPETLTPCPPSPNCLCSEDKNAKAWVMPLSFEDDADLAWAQVVGIVESLGGEIVYHNDEYLHAVFTSLIFRFKDDLELRLDFENRMIQLRSASRVGHSDFGVNRRRIERLRDRFEKRQL